VSTVLLDRPAQARAGGGAPARRAVTRWAWRLFRREWRQQLLVLALVTVAVAATGLGAAVGVNTPPPRDAGFGTADHLVSLPGADPHLAADIAAIRQRFGTVDVIEDQSIATGMVQGARLRAADPTGAYVSPMLDLDSGRYPAGADEVAMTAGLASSLDLRVGDVWHQSGRALHVVGLVENPQNLLDEFALVAPGQMSVPDRVTVLFDAAPQDVAAFTFPAGAHAQAPHPPQGFDPAVVVLVVAIFGLVFVGLVAVAGFSVLGQRRLRALGMLSSLGATDRNIRLVMIANGGLVGAVAALIGAVVGFAAWIAYAPHLQTSAHHRVVWYALPWWLIAATIVLAVVTPVLASVRPARAAARLSIVAALSGRPVPPKPTHRSAVPGIVLLAGGIVLLAFCGGWGGNGGKDLLFELGGLLATTAGLLLLAPAATTLLGVLARWAPLPVRLALRDLARYRARSGAALAAISFAVLIAMMICLIATGRYADPVDYFAPNLAANQLVAYVPGPGPGSNGPEPVTATPQPAATGLQASVDEIASAVGSHNVLALATSDAQLGKVVPNRGVLNYSSTIYVATPALLAHYGIDPATIDPTAMFLTSRPGLDHTDGLQLLYGPPQGPGPDCNPGSCIADPKIQVIPSLPVDAAAPDLVVTSHAVQSLNIPVTPAGWLMQTPQPLTAGQINAARQAAAAAGMTIETKSDAPSLSQLRNYATAIGILLALAVLAMTVGLIRGESAGDVQTLTATGASAWTRRAITAATAGALGLVGALLGTGVAYLATFAFFRSQLSERMTDVPVTDLVLVVVGLPVAAAIGSWLLAGREPPTITRQPIG
jgi:putative ABC transport system permease protein